MDMTSLSTYLDFFDFSHWRFIVFHIHNLNEFVRFVTSFRLLFYMVYFFNLHFRLLFYMVFFFLPSIPIINSQYIRIQLIFVN